MTRVLTNIVSDDTTQVPLDDRDDRIPVYDIYEESFEPDGVCQSPLEKLCPSASAMQQQRLAYLGGIDSQLLRRMDEQRKVLKSESRLLVWQGLVSAATIVRSGVYHQLRKDEKRRQRRHERRRCLEESN